MDPQKEEDQEAYRLVERRMGYRHQEGHHKDYRHQEEHHKDYRHPEEHHSHRCTAEEEGKQVLEGGLEAWHTETVEADRKERLPAEEHHMGWHPPAAVGVLAEVERRKDFRHREVHRNQAGEGHRMLAADSWGTLVEGVAEGEHHSRHRTHLVEAHREGHP